MPPRLHRALACAARREPAPHSRRKRSQPWNGGVIARRRVLHSRYAAAVATAAGRAPRPRARFWQPGAQERISRDDGQPAAESLHVGSKQCAPIHGNSVERRLQPAPSAGWKVVCSAPCSCALARVQRAPTETVAPLRPLAASERRPTVCVCRLPEAGARPRRARGRQPCRQLPRIGCAKRVGELSHLRSMAASAFCGCVAPARAVLHMRAPGGAGAARPGAASKSTQAHAPTPRQPHEPPAGA